MAQQGRDGEVDGKWAWSVGSGLFTVLLAAVALLLPDIDWAPSGGLVGWLLFLAGAAELAFSSRRIADFTGRAGMISGILTALAGLIFIAKPFAGYFPVTSVVVAWLLLRGGLILAISLRRGRSSACTWLAMSGTVDILLGLLLIAGLPVASLVVSLFGPTREIVANFSLILSASFVVTGACQIAIGLAQRSGR